VTNTSKGWDSSTRVERSVSQPNKQVKTNPNESSGNITAADFEKDKATTPVNPGNKVI